MRSKSMRVDIRIPGDGSNKEYIGSLDVETDGTVTKRSIDNREQQFHLDTDEGMDRFINYIATTARYQLAREIKSKLYL